LPSLARALSATADGRPKPIHLGFDLSTCVFCSVDNGLKCLADIAIDGGTNAYSYCRVHL
jgi:hypothetical protein